MHLTPFELPFPFAARALSVALAAAATALPAVATPPPPTYLFDGHSVAGPGTYSDGGATVTFAASPTAAIDLTVDNPSGGSGGGRATLTYYYEITAASSFQSVAGTIATSMFVSGASSNGFEAQAFITLPGLAIGPTDRVCASTYPDHASICPSSFLSSLNNTLAVNFLPSGRIDLDALVGVSAPGHGQAFIDPVITLPAGYTLTLSAGVGNGTVAVSPVPEPEIAGLMMVGLGALGCVTRRRKPKTQTTC